MKTFDVTIGWTKSQYEKDEKGQVVSILYSSFMGWEPGAEQYSLSMKVLAPEGTTAFAVAESAFIATNAPYELAEGSMGAQIRATLELLGFDGSQSGHYSLSTGDTVTVDGVTLACESCGWKEVVLT